MTSVVRLISEMSLAAITTFLALVGSLGTAIPRNWSRFLRLASLPALYVCFVTLYLFVGDEVAQDRAEYFRWYQDSSDILEIPGSRDQLFTLFLSILPDGLSRHEFGFLFISVIFFLIVIVLWLLAKRNILTWNHVPLIIIAIVCDRLFLDLALNASRSTIAALVFLVGLIPKRIIARLAIFALAYGIHSGIFFLLLLLYLGSTLVRSKSIGLQLLLVLAVMAFGARLVFGVALLPEGIFSFALSYVDSQTVIRGITRSGSLTYSIATQIAIGVIIPLLLIAYKKIRNIRKRNYGIGIEAVAVQERILTMTLIGSALSLLFYPDLALIHRLYIIPVFCLPMFLSVRYLKGLAVFKFFVMLVLLPSLLP